MFHDFLIYHFIHDDDNCHDRQKDIHGYNYMIIIVIIMYSFVVFDQIVDWE